MLLPGAHASLIGGGNDGVAGIHVGVEDAFVAAGSESVEDGATVERAEADIVADGDDFDLGQRALGIEIFDSEVDVLDEAKIGDVSGLNVEVAIDDLRGIEEVEG